MMEEEEENRDSGIATCGEPRMGRGFCMLSGNGCKSKNSPWQGVAGIGLGAFSSKGCRFRLSQVYKLYVLNLSKI